MLFSKWNFTCLYRILECFCLLNCSTLFYCLYYHKSETKILERNLWQRKIDKNRWKVILYIAFYILFHDHLKCFYLLLLFICFYNGLESKAAKHVCIKRKTTNILLLLLLLSYSDTPAYNFTSSRKIAQLIKLFQK